MKTTVSRNDLVNTLVNTKVHAKFHQAKRNAIQEL